LQKIGRKEEKTMAFDYFYGQEDAEQFLFYRIPKTLITGEEFREVSVEAKLFTD